MGSEENNIIGENIGQSDQKVILSFPEVIINTKSDILKNVNINDYEVFDCSSLKHYNELKENLDN